jgi:hypothetical protein
MKKFLILVILFTTVTFVSQAQRRSGLFKKRVAPDTSKNSSVTDTTNAYATVAKGDMPNETIADGLKEALQIGVERSAVKLSSVDGFFKDAAIKILMPEEAKKVEQKLRSLGLGKVVDKAILGINRAAEDASKSAVTIFVNAVKQMSVKDAVKIFTGGDFAATNYLKDKTTITLTEAFRPIIEQSLSKADATKHWNTLFTTYNRFSKEDVNTDLSAYVTEKAMAGIFYQVSLEEQKIRKDPMAQTTDLLKNVFGKRS